MAYDKKNIGAVIEDINSCKIYLPAYLQGRTRSLKDKLYEFKLRVSEEVTF